MAAGVIHHGLGGLPATQVFGTEALRLTGRDAVSLRAPQAQSQETSEEQFQTKLNVPVLRGGGTDLPERSRVRVATGRGKVRVVEGIEGLSPELQPEFLRKPKVLIQAEIEVLQSRANQDISTGVPI